jgi:ubiquinone/menaquinone biosynthesis C-methylase UbiE
MSAPDPAIKPHSAEYFGEQRDFWWNDDFVALMARRWELDRVKMALDVGAGVGHWGRLLLPHLAPEARLFGIDREAEWVRGANERAARLGIAGRASYRFGDANEIPFHDGVFDLVTCQTVLIHMKDPAATIREMMRVLAPGGLLAVAEPNNLANALALGSTLAKGERARVLELARFQMTCELGKERLGEGNNSLGDLVPGMFAAAGLEDVKVFISDKAFFMVPPYRRREEQARRDEALAWAEREDMWSWDRRDTERFFRAGGGSAEDFERLWALGRATMREIAAALRANEEHTAGGGLHYLISGRKPR